MDNITVTTLALKQHRQHFPDPSQRLYWHKNTHSQEQLRKIAFDRWVTSRLPEFYLFYRVTGLRELIARPKVQTRLNLLPHLMFDNRPTLYSIFNKPFELFAYIDTVEPYEDEWLSVSARVARYTEQPITIQIHDECHIELEDVLKHLAFPLGATDLKRSNDAPSFKDVSKLRYYRFHMLYHPSKKFDKCYGVIDQMWNKSDAELQLKLPPHIKTL